MYQSKFTGFVIFFVFVLSVATFGQSVLRLVPWDGTAATELITQIKADTLANHGIPADRVYELEGGKNYICTEQFYVEARFTLRLKSSNNLKPVIYMYPTGVDPNPQNPPGQIIRLRGADLEMTGIALTGIFEPVPSSLDNIQGAMLRVDTEGSSVILKDCLFTNTNGQVLRTEGSTVLIKIVDCIFTNLGALTTSNFGAGKGLDLRAASCDSLILINNTFTNYQDRVIRHYNVNNPLVGTGNIYYALIDHNTIYNGMGFHGLFSLGNVGNKVTITNNLFKDAFAAGEDPTDGTRYAEWGNTGEVYPQGGNRMMWIFTAPNDTTEWVVKNNFYSISAEGQAFFDAHTAEPITEGSPLSHHIKTRLGADSTAAFTKIPDPGFVKTQALMTNLMNWYLSPGGGNKTKETGNFNKETDDMDRRVVKFWTDTLNIAYSTTSPAYTGAENGFPAGNLNAFPDKKAEWENYDPTDVQDVVSPEEYSLSQNYPNPFNPSTTINYTLPEVSSVKLIVYNSIGQEIATLVNQEQSAGRYNITWDASNVSTGIYFYKLQTGKATFTRKMLLIK